MSHKIWDNGVIREMTPEEITEEERIDAEREKAYWAVPYEEAVSREIHETYSIDAELAILRQKDSKPDEWAKYNAHCEDCKAYVHAKRKEFGLE